MKKILVMLSAALMIAACTSGADSSQIVSSEKLSSPDGNLELTFMMTDKGIPEYSLKFDGKDVVLPSKLGFVIRGGERKESFEDLQKKTYGPEVSLYDCFVLENVERSMFDETWETVWGEESHIRNNYNEMLVSLVQPSHEGSLKMKIRFRLYDDGLGFRYEFPQQEALTYFVVADELTEFAMTGDHTAWWVPGDYDTQEYNFTESRLSEIPSLMDKAADYNASQMTISRTSVQTALQMRTDDSLYINIHEAEVLDYPTTSLTLDEARKTFKTALTPDAQGWMARLQAPCKTPWRTVMVVDDARKVLSSRLILNLNEPCAIEDVSWIHPTKYMGVWWEMITGKSSWAYTNEYPAVQLGVTDYSVSKPNGTHGANNENVRRYIDFAAENGFDGILVEGWNEGWEDWFGNQKDYVFDFVTPYPDFDIAALNAYAHSKGIRIIMHHETSSSTVNYERHMEAAYNLMNEYGYDAVKSGYVGDIIPYGEHHYSQSLINHYHYAVTEAARHHIMVNAHEAVRPTGLCRTWPNMIGNESARGTEFKGGILPHHVTILPFTRLQGGPMDYTPGIFEMDMSKLWEGNTDSVQTTICKQLAMYVTMYSPLQMAADLPEHYSRYMDAFQFIKDVAVDWEQSKYLLAEPGDYIVVARQARKSTMELASKGVASLKGGKKNYVNGASAFCLTDVNGKKADKDVWFVGGVTDESGRELSFALDFLKPGVSYEATIYEDGPEADYHRNPYAYRISKQTVDSTTVLNMVLARSGGFAISLKEI